MKVANAFAFFFAVFAFLMLGSLLIIVSTHLLSFDDAILKVQEIYQSPWRSAQSGIVGLVFIVLGLMFAKMLVKEGRPNEAIIFHNNSGLVVVSTTTIETAALKTIRRFTQVKSARVKVTIVGKNIEMRIRLMLWSGAQVSSLMSELQDEIHARVKRLLGPDNQLIVTCDVRGIEEVNPNLQDMTSNIK